MHDLTKLGLVGVPLPNLKSVIIHDVSSHIPAADVAHSFTTVGISNWTYAKDVLPFFKSSCRSLQRLAWHQSMTAEFLHLLPQVKNSLAFLAVNTVSPKLLAVLPELVNLNTFVFSVLKKQNGNINKVSDSLPNKSIKTLGINLPGWEDDTTLKCYEALSSAISEPVFNKLEKINFLGIDLEKDEKIEEGVALVEQLKNAGVEVWIYQISQLSCHACSSPEPQYKLSSTF